MLLAYRDQKINFRFGFNNGINYYDPLLQTPPKDVYISIMRGLNGYGNIILNPISLINSSFRITNISAGIKDASNFIHPTLTFAVNHNLDLGEYLIIYGVGGNYDGEYEVEEIVSNTSIKVKAYKPVSLSLSSYDNTKHIARAVIKSSSYIQRVSDSEYNFIYTVPDNLHPGQYTVIVKTEFASEDKIVEISFQVSQEKALKTARISSAKVENNIATIYTKEEHNFSTEDYISIQTESLTFNGNYYIQSIPSANQITYQLNAPNSNLQNFSSLGRVDLINTEGLSPTLAGPNQPTKISYRPIYDSLQPFSTNSILLLGHADGVQLNDIIRINSIQEAVNLLGADGRSPLLRGVFEAYNSGAKDIFICAVAPMSEYVDSTSDRNERLATLHSPSATPSNRTFYEKYYERLEATYSVVKYYEFIDIIVPLEASMIQTSGVDFVTQLAAYCTDFHNTTGFVQIGIIGSRSNGIKDSDIVDFESSTKFKNKYTTYDVNGEISSDIGRFIIPIYGELNFNHIGFPVSYTGTAAAAFAGTVSSTEVSRGIIRKRLPAGYSLYGADLSADSLARLDNLGINTIYRGRRAKRGNPYEVFISNDYTMAAKNSVFSKLPQVRLAAMVINEIKSIGYNSIGKFAYETVVSKVKSMLNILVAAKAINNYNLDAYADRYIKGSMIFQLTLISSLNLKTINFSVTAGPGA